MKKYGKVLMVGIVTFCASISAVYAKEKVTVQELLNEAVEISPNAKDVYIVGDYAFTSNHTMTSQDIMLAARSIDVGDKTGKTNTGGVYPEMVMQHFNRKKTNGVYTEWSIVDPKIGTADKKWEDFKTKKISVHYIDYNLVNDVSADVEETLKDDVETLKASATKYGFNDITYENHTLTFDISDLNKKLVGYANSGIVDMFNTIVNDEYGFTSITYIGKEGKVTKYKGDVGSPESLAGEMLLVLAGKDKTSVKPSELTYLDVANKSTTATVKYTDPKYGEKEVTYTLKFTYDTKTEKNKDLTEAANELNVKAKTYGFKSVSYKNETATFEIEDTTKTLVGFSTSGILDMFDKYIAGATKIEYTVGVTSVSIDPVDSSKKTEYAAQLLCLMANDGNADKCVAPDAAKTLTLGDVANKSAKAKFTYTIGDETEEISYTLKFNYDLETVKNDAIQADIAALNEKININNGVFSSVVYDTDSHTVTFTIKDLSKKISDFSNGIMDFNKMFNEFVKDAESIIYAVDNESQDISGSSSAVQIARILLCKMAGKGDNCGMTDIELSDLNGKSATATVRYKVGGDPIKYTVKFDTDPAAQASMLKFNSNNKVFRLN